MPLEQGSSKEAISKNIATEMQHGKPQKQAVAIAMREAGMPKPAKDAAGPAHDPSTGQFTSGGGSGSAKSGTHHVYATNKKTGARTQMTSNPVTEKEARTMMSKLSPHRARTLSVEAANPGKDQQPTAITQAASGSPAYGGRNLDAGQSCDAGISAPCAGDGGWPGRSL